MVHEFWCCQREFNTFLHHASDQIFKGIDTKEQKLLMFTAYGNFLRHLYSFYEKVVKEERNLKVFNESSGKNDAEKTSEVLVWEVEKLIRNKSLRYEKIPGLDKREIAHLTEKEVPKDFGTHFRFIRNGFSHSDPKRLNNNEVSLIEFYEKYHKYVLLLYESTLFTWNVKVEDFDWADIENFSF